MALALHWGGITDSLNSLTVELVLGYGGDNTPAGKIEEEYQEVMRLMSRTIPGGGR
ncbi:hypothetical protein FH972_012822 [Carpinus fangiana]|uniref:Uncharacterized protein n=1 Tax=Carpinus fangiana TaxID=176857 RepID=A0A5N6R4V2_9ROSI|nr:hypothetical protein FH972_012822 [Carpinus fangiana]